MNSTLPLGSLTSDSIDVIGPKINIIKKGENYGWPMASYGINYIGTKFTDKTSIAGFPNSNLSRSIRNRFSNS